MRHEGFTLQLDLEQDGTMRWYSNIGLPPTITDEEIHFVDLDVDLIARELGEWQLVDEEEFDINRIRYGYPNKLVEQVWHTVAEVKRRIEHQQFPFHGSLERRLIELAQRETPHFR
jgi:protein associated with RNAse G/E